MTRGPGGPHGLDAPAFGDEPRRERRERIVNLKPGWLDVYCWCMAEIVSVTEAEVAAVLTRSCGRPRCKRPEP